MAPLENVRRLASAKLARLIEQAGSTEDVIIDLTDVSFIDSAGLSALLQAHRKVIERGGPGLTLKHPLGAVRKVLAFTRLDKVFKIIDCPDEELTELVQVKEVKEKRTTLSHTPLHCSFPALKTLIPKSLELARKYLEEAHIENELLDQLDIVLSEAITNAVVHGGRGNKRAQVTLDIEVIGTQIRFIIGDEGAGFSLADVPEPDFSGEQLGGRGVYIMRSIMDEVRYETRPAGALNLLFLDLTIENEENNEDNS